MYLFDFVDLSVLKKYNRTEHNLYYHSGLTKTYEDMAKYNQESWHDALQSSTLINI